MDKNTGLMTQLNEEDLLEFSQREESEIEKPIQELFDNCLNFISVCDFLEM